MTYKNHHNDYDHTTIVVNAPGSGWTLATDWIQAHIRKWTTADWQVGLVLLLVIWILSFQNHGGHGHSFVMIILNIRGRGGFTFITIIIFFQNHNHNHLRSRKLPDAWYRFRFPNNTYARIPTSPPPPDYQVAIVLSKNVHGLRGNLYPQLVERSEESKSFQLIFTKCLISLHSMFIRKVKNSLFRTFSKTTNLGLQKSKFFKRICH